MKARRLLLSLAVCWFAIATYAADNPNMGTWKLNEAKSKIPTGAGKNTTVVYTPDGDNVKVTIDGVDGKGQPTHSEWVGKFDGKEYPVTGGGAGTTRSYKAINDRQTEVTVKVNGKETLHGTIEVAKDGKSRTVKAENTASDGNKMKTEAVYDKQ